MPGWRGSRGALWKITRSASPKRTPPTIRRSHRRCPPARRPIVDDLPAIWRDGMGYRATFAGGFQFHLQGLRMERGDLSGRLLVSAGDQGLFRGRFNCSSLTTRAATAKYLNERLPYSGWLAMLERFCWHVAE